MQQPFPDRNHLYRMAICLNLGLVVAGNDVAVIARKGFQEFDDGSHFSLVGPFFFVTFATKKRNWRTRLWGDVVL